MPGPAVIPVASDFTLPKRVDVVIIGGGIIGTSTALDLCERGYSVLLCEKGQIGGEQSSRNWGWVRISMRDPREIPLMIKSISIWEGLDARTNHKTGYTKTGILWPADTDRKQAEYARWATHLTAQGIDCPMLSPHEIDGICPGHNMPSLPGLFAPGDGRAEPQWATSAIAKGARAAGCTIMTNCAVRCLDLAAGRVAGVVTEKGIVACDSVVVAGGVWSRMFAGNAGIELPQLNVLGSVMRTTPVSSGPEVALHGKGFALRKRCDGGYTIVAGTGSVVDIVPDTLRLAPAFWPALKNEYKNLRFRLGKQWVREARLAKNWRQDEETPFEQCRILDPKPDSAALRQGWINAKQAFPALNAAAVEQCWAGLMDVTPDALPVISRVDTTSGLFIASGFSGHGFGIGPAAGRSMADLVSGATPLVDPSDFRLSRFSDGTKLAPKSGF